MGPQSDKTMRVMHVNHAIGGVTVKLYGYGRPPEGFDRFMDDLAMPFIGHRVCGHLLPQLSDTCRQAGGDSKVTGCIRLEFVLNDVKCELIVSTKIATAAPLDVIENIIFYGIIKPFKEFLDHVSFATMFVKEFDELLQDLERLATETLGYEEGQSPDGNGTKRQRPRGLRFFARR